MEDSDLWDKVSYVISSQYRVEILERLSEGPATPSLISDDVGSSITHVSRALQELRELGLVDLLVSEDRKKGRVYGTTEEGLTIWSKIKEENMV
jgi:DNA-binding transcriptional ArsR family regulator